MLAGCLAACQSASSGTSGLSASSSASAGATDTSESSSHGPTTGDAGSATTTATSSTGSDTTSDASASAGGSGPKFDVGVPVDGGDVACISHTPCDGDGDPWHALGIGCPGEPVFQTSIDAHPDGIMVLSGFGQGDTYAPREGSEFLLLSTGVLPDRIWTEPDGPNDSLGHCNMWFTPGDGMDTTKFPPPIVAKDVAGDCLQDPSLVGTGDCSKTIQGQFEQSGFKYDYQEFRFSGVVPEGVDTLAFDVAYLTTEWPVFSGQPYNDMFIAWVETPTWSGNVSFDDGGQPLSLNAAFLEFKDANGDLPQFAGTCLRWHGGTRWLSSSIAVTPGDPIEVVFAIFDLDDVNWDSMVLLDNVRWTCDGADPGPDTKPAG
ncbi:MAG: hypothetical protein D6705_12430 [Deltaproteobacteria bacterium]|nr:MAG: hypothetical protein D6705_12430 [Deltaproteobacteria bacterium]